MKRSFANAILCLAVVAMLAGTANAIDWVTVAQYNFNELPPVQPAPETPGFILDSSGNGHNGTAVGQEMQGDPAVLTLTPPTYVDPLCDPIAGLQLHKGFYNELGPGVPPENIQDRVEVPMSPDFNLMLQDGMSYRMETQVNLTPFPYTEEGRADRDSGVVATYYARVLEGDGDDIVGQVPANGWIWRIEQNGYNPPGNNLPTAQFAFRVGGSWNSTDGRTNIMDGVTHTIAVELLSSGGNTTVQLYCDGNPDGPSQTFASANVIIPDTGFKQGLWIGDFLGRWDDQLVGTIDAFSIKSVPEPSSIVLLVMGALALVAIRRVR